MAACVAELSMIAHIQATSIAANKFQDLFFRDQGMQANYIEDLLNSPEALALINTYKEFDDGTATEDLRDEENFWDKRAKWVTEAAEALLPIAAKHFESPSLCYCKFYIGINSGSRSRVWFHKRTSPEALLNFEIAPPMQNDAATLLVSASIGYTKKSELFRVTIDRRTIESKSDVLEKLMEFVKRTADGKG